MIHETRDADILNELINDPAIRPTVGGEGPLDVSFLLSDPRNIALIDEGGGALFRWTGPRIFEGHSFFRARGRTAISLGSDMLAHMAGRADLIWGLTPAELRHVRWFNRKIGMRSLGMMTTPEGEHELFEMRF